ncbi:MAG: DUF3472 domain-containing protein [Bacteroidota bacterium]
MFCIILILTLLDPFYVHHSANTSDSSSIIVPLGGNSWITASGNQDSAEVTDDGWKSWSSKETQFSVFVKVRKSGTLKMSAMMRVPDGKSAIQCTINNVSNVTIARGPEWIEYPFGSWVISDTGYIRLDFRGMKKTGQIFAEIKELRLSGSAVDQNTAIVKNNDGNYFYWGRRGPSVHINYDAAEFGNDVEWFYSEITVPEGNDVIGSYFMANGFKEGYFGIQVNSSTERRVLFSVWSPFQTDDPSAIPDDKKIVLKGKGSDVHAGEFGNEGSGGQSYLVFPWTANNTYRFLLHAQPTGDAHTTFTAYFYAPEVNTWKLIASFSRPATDTYLTRLHSFLENFEPNTGYITRKALYGNQWVRSKGGKWKSLSKMTFTGDATAQKGFRLDYAGGTEGSAFFLRNCGFFNEQTMLRSTFIREVTNTPPEIDLTTLDK